MSHTDTIRIIDALEASTKYGDWLGAVDAETGELRWIAYEQASGNYLAFDTVGITMALTDERLRADADAKDKDPACDYDKGEG